MDKRSCVLRLFFASLGTVALLIYFAMDNLQTAPRAEVGVVVSEPAKTARQPSKATSTAVRLVSQPLPNLQEAEVRFNLLTLPSSRFADQQLGQPASIHCERISLRQNIAQVEANFRIRCWIDRRVDADKLLTLNSDATLRECLSRLARLCDAEIGLIENVITIAPPGRLAAMQYTAVRLHDQLSRGEPANANRAELRPLRWDMLTTPSELLAIAAKNWSVEFADQLPNVPPLPHDLMNAGQLQPSTVATQLTLVLGGFDRCAFGSTLSQLRMTSIPESRSWQAIYAESEIPPANPTVLTAEHPGAVLKKVRTQYELLATTEAHLRLLRPIASAPTRAPRPSGSGSSKINDPIQVQRFTIPRTEPQGVKAILSAFAAQSGLGLEVNWAPSLSSAQLLSPVVLDAKNAKLDEILASLAKQAKLNIVRFDRVIEVKPIQTAVNPIPE